jgi:hypothetical protein
MTATYTFDVFSSLDGFGAACGDWTHVSACGSPAPLTHTAPHPLHHDVPANQGCTRQALGGVLSRRCTWIH